MIQFIFLGLLIALFFVGIREDVKNFFNKQQQSSKTSAKNKALADMAEENMPTMLLKHDNFFKETYW